MRADSLSRVYTRELRQPGDVYGSGRIRLPARAVRGELEVLAEMYQPRSNPRLEVYETTHECVFNTADMIVPNLLVGDATERYVGVAVLNLKGRALENVRARIIESEIFEATELQVPALGAQTVTQLSFLLRPKSAVAESEEPLQATLQIDSPSLDFSYRLEIDVGVTAATSNHRQTFRSAMDLSTQYYGVVPPFRRSDSVRPRCRPQSSWCICRSDEPGQFLPFKILGLYCCTNQSSPLRLRLAELGKTRCS